MRKPFNGEFRLTQKFGENPAYYKQFGFAGHEGVDWGLPDGTPVTACARGTVVRRNDVKDGAYGIYTVLYHKELSLATWYCHLQEVKVSLGQDVNEGDIIALSDNTGNTTGSHLHLNLCRTDSNGYRINTDNGYKGFIDPLPFLEQQNEIDPEIIKRADAFIVVCDKLNKPVDKDIVLADIDRLITLEDKLRERDKELSEKGQQITNLDQQLQELKLQKEELITRTNIMQSDVQDLGNKLTVAAREIEKLKQIKPASQYSISELIVMIIKRFFGGR